MAGLYLFWCTSIRNSEEYSISSQKSGTSSPSNFGCHQLVKFLLFIVPAAAIPAASPIPEFCIREFLREAIPQQFQ
jgi:hypothetical protein